VERNRADLNGDNLRIYRAYLRISDHCRVTVRVRVRVMIKNMVRVGVSIRVSVRVGVADCCIQTAGKSDKMQIILSCSNTTTAKNNSKEKFIV